MDNRLRLMEAAVNEQATDINKVVSNSNTEKEEFGRISEGDVSRWMDETLRFGYSDTDLTILATDKAEQSLEKAPGVNLEDMQCSKRFCRATFAHQNGDQPDIKELIGEPPFVNEGFTINEPDGRIVLYFAQPGETLEELRSEAREDIDFQFFNKIDG